MEWAGGRERGGLERLDVLMRVSIYHAINERVFSVFKFDIFDRLQLATRKMNVERDIVRSLVQCVALRDLWSWSIIFPSSTRVNLQPFIG